MWLAVSFGPKTRQTPTSLYRILKTLRCCIITQVSHRDEGPIRHAGALNQEVIITRVFRQVIPAHTDRKVLEMKRLLSHMLLLDHFPLFFPKEDYNYILNDRWVRTHQQQQSSAHFWGLSLFLPAFHPARI